MTECENRFTDGVNESCHVLELSFDRITSSFSALTSPTAIHPVDGETLFELRAHQPPSGRVVRSRAVHK
jgi:hypothetical protein